MNKKTKMTKMAKYGGCAAKVRPSELLDLLTLFPESDDPNLIAGIDAFDDAGIYKLNEDTAIVFNVDYITPVVDDPEIYGEIAVANALSDLYAKGATPLLAMNVMGYDTTKLFADDVQAILRGGLRKCQEAGSLIVGGHTLEAPECFFGLACIGICKPEQVLLNSTAKAGDHIVVTKPMGTGVIATVTSKFGEDLHGSDTAAIEVMRTLNKTAAEIMGRYHVSSCVDVTGFGLIGHLWEIMRYSHVGASLRLDEVPALEEAARLVERAFHYCSIERNQYHYEPYVTYRTERDETYLKLLYDSQTSGGLLLTVAPDQSAAMVEEMRAAGVEYAALIGEVTSDDGRIEVL